MRHAPTGLNRELSNNSYCELFTDPNYYRSVPFLYGQVEAEAVLLQTPLK